MDQPLILKELDWAEQGPLPSIGSLRPHWRQDVSLDCKISPEDSHARACTAYYYDLLQGTLQQEGLPETIDRTKEPCTGACLHPILWGSTAPPLYPGYSGLPCRELFLCSS